MNVNRVCGSCRYYSAGRCHVNPPEPMMKTAHVEQWARPPVGADDIGCQHWKIPVELERRQQQQLAEAWKRKYANDTARTQILPDVRR